MGPIDRLMTRNFRTNEIESHKTNTAKKFRETSPSEVIPGAEAWLVVNPSRSTLTSDFLRFHEKEIQLYRYNDVSKQWEKTTNPLPPQVTNEFIAASNGWDDGLYIKSSNYMQVYAIGKIDMMKTPLELIVNGTEYHGREQGVRGSEAGSGGITSQNPIVSQDDNAEAVAFVEMIVPGKTMKTIPGNPLCSSPECKQGVRDSPISERHAVRCCWNKDSKLSMMSFGCNDKKTYSEAKETCAKSSFRLCTVQEVMAGKVAETGCGFDLKRIWTSSGGDDGDDDMLPLEEKKIALAKDPVGDCVTVPGG